MSQNRPRIATAGATVFQDDIDAYKPYLNTRKYKGNILSVFKIHLAGWCSPNRPRRREEENFYLRGVRDFEKAIDVLHLIRNQKRLKILERAVFNPAQLQLSKLSKYNYLRNNLTSSSDDQEYAVKHERTLNGYKLSAPIDAALLK